MQHVFLSYRRSDSQFMTARLYDRILSEIGSNHVFRDVDSIPLGVEFHRVLDEEIARCDVLIAIVGPLWLHAIDSDGCRRLENPNDFVRIEIEAAIARQIPIFVALVDDTPMPSKDKLPPSLATVSDQSEFPLRPDPLFHDDSARLIDAVRNIPIRNHWNLASRFRWARAIELGTRRAILGELTGILIGLANMAAYRLLERGYPDWQWEELRLLPLAAPGLVGGAILGARHFRIRGLILGLVAGIMIEFILFILTAITFGFPWTILVGIISKLGWIGEMRAETDPISILCGIIAGVTALPAGLFATELILRRIARRERVKFAIPRIISGIFLGATLGCTLSAVVFHFAVGAGKGLSENIRENISVVALTTTWIGLLSVSDVLISEWKRG